MKGRAALAFGIPTAFAVVLLLLRSVGVLAPGSGPVLHVPNPSFDRETIGRGDPSQAVQAALVTRIIDGDTLDLAGRRVRLHGIDAPERSQVCQRPSGPYSCGEEATRQLEAIIGGRPLRCVEYAVDRNGRSISLCTAGETDIGRVMVERGWAVAARRYSSDYVADEEAARRRGVGLWAGPFDRPENWRAQRRNE